MKAWAAGTSKCCENSYRVETTTKCQALPQVGFHRPGEVHPDLRVAPPLLFCDLGDLSFGELLLAREEQEARELEPRAAARRGEELVPELGVGGRAVEVRVGERAPLEVDPDQPGLRDRALV